MVEHLDNAFEKLRCYLFPQAPEQTSGELVEEDEEEEEEEDAPQVSEIILERGGDGLGFSIVGGHGSPHGDLPIYVKVLEFDSTEIRRTSFLSS